jgi:hypothetical protein
MEVRIQMEYVASHDDGAFVNGSSEVRGIGKGIVLYRKVGQSSDRAAHANPAVFKIDIGQRRAARVSARP